MPILLTRDAFREAVFARDGHKCVVCGEAAVDAHHILERRLWADGGYYVENGASVCAQHHMDCEKTLISVEQIREYAGITKPVIPEHMYPDTVYDKWGNVILNGEFGKGLRLPGELFHDESVQKILAEANLLHMFVANVKYPRTYHVPWSENVTDDDRVIPDMSIFHNKPVVVTEKMDGENTSIYFDGYVHARSIDGRNHWSRDWVKNFAQNFAYDLPERWRVCGENLYAEHSIHYDTLPSYFMGFSIWNEDNMCLDWEHTLEWFQLLGIEPVPTLYFGIYDEKLIRNLPLDTERQEGYVIRLAQEFHFRDFRRSVAKYVRKGHVQTTKHWFFGSADKTNEVRLKHAHGTTD